MSIYNKLLLSILYFLLKNIKLLVLNTKILFFLTNFLIIFFFFKKNIKFYLSFELRGELELNNDFITSSSLKKLLLTGLVFLCKIPFFNESGD